MAFRWTVFTPPGAVSSPLGPPEGTVEGAGMFSPAVLSPPGAVSSPLAPPEGTVVSSPLAPPEGWVVSSPLAPPEGTGVSSPLAVLSPSFPQGRFPGGMGKGKFPEGAGADLRREGTMVRGGVRGGERALVEMWASHGRVTQR